jgi:predicted dehydrogenase
METIDMADKGPRFGIVGCGHWGKNYLRLLASLPEVNLTLVCDQDEGLLAQRRTRYPHVTFSTQLDRVLSRDDCDAVIIATPASSHYRLVTQALTNGLDVLVEKPITLVPEEARQLASLARERARVLMVAHTFLFNPAIRQIKRYLDTDVVGDIYYIKTRRTHLGLVRDDVNSLWDLAPHDISILLYLLGETPIRLQAMGRRILRRDREDAAFVNLEFPSGVMAHVHVSWADANKERYLDIVGSRARVTFDDLNVLEPIRVFRKGIAVESNEIQSFGEFKYMVRDEDIVSPKVFAEEPLAAQFQEFLTAVRERTDPVSNGDFGAQVVEVLKRIEEHLQPATVLRAAA